MRKDWNIKELEEVCEIEYGTRVVRKRDGGSKYPVYGGGGATFFMDTYNRENCLIVARFAMSEQCTRFVNGKFFLNDSGLSVKVKDTNEINQDFLNYQFLHLNDYIYSLARGAAQKNLNVPAFKKINIRYPKSLPEQKRIVAILDRAFEAIDQAKANAEQNLKNARELFESYSKTLYGKLICENDKELLGNIAKLVRGPFGGSLKKSMFVEKGYAVYEQRNAIGDFTDNFRYFIDEKKFNEMERFSVKTGDMLMSCSGTIGKFTIVKENYTKGIINQALLKISPDTKKIDNKFLLFVLSNFIQDGSSHSKGAAIKNIIAVKELKKIEIPLLNIDAQKQIVAQLDKLQAETKRLEAIYQKKIDNLKELKKSILHKAFRGELTEKAVNL